MKIIMLLYFVVVVLNVAAQPTEKKLYNPGTNAEKDIAGIIKKAKAENKNIFIQAGGNWCVWCLEFNKFCQSDKQIDSIISADYIVYHLNYSPENKNESLFAR